MLFPTFFPSWSPRSFLSFLTWQKSSGSKVETLVEAHTSLATLFQGLEGSKLVIPSLEALSPAWKVNINPHLESIRSEFNLWVTQWFKDERIRQKIAALDADGFAAMGYPGTGRTELLNLSRLIAWYFPWDDAIDDAAMLQQPADVIRYRDETIQLVKEALLSDREAPSKPSSNPAIQSFWDIGTYIRAKGSQDSSQRFAEQQCLFIASSAQSQIGRKNDQPLTVEQYLRRREDNIAIHPLMELIYYAYQIEIPSHWRHENNEHMRIMWKEIAWMGIMLKPTLPQRYWRLLTARLLRRSNDLLSLRRELIHGQFESLVPLLMYHQKIQPQEAVDRTTAMIHDSYGRFYKEEQALYKEAAPEQLDNLKACVQVFKDLVMCNLHWSYGLKRYMESSMIREDGTVVFDIRLPGPKLA